MVAAIPFALAVRKTEGPDRTVGIVAVAAAVGVGVVNLLKSAGWLEEGPIYWTFNIAFIVLFWTLFFLRVVRRKRSTP